MPMDAYRPVRSAISCLLTGAGGVLIPFGAMSEDPPEVWVCWLWSAFWRDRDLFDGCGVWSRVSVFGACVSIVAVLSNSEFALCKFCFKFSDSLGKLFNGKSGSFFNCFFNIRRFIRHRPLLSTHIMQCTLHIV